jgi:hypothetical protein
MTAHFPSQSTPLSTMLSSLFRPSRSSKRQRDTRSPFSSPSPAVTRRHPPHERTQLLSQDQANAPGIQNTSRTDSDEEDHTDHDLDDEEFESGNEDGVREEAPLLPIFSAAHLGSNLFLQVLRLWTCTDANRCTAHIQLNPCHTPPDRVQMRNHVIMGPTSITTSVTVSPQTNPAGHSSYTLFQSNTIRVDGQLSTI